MPIGLAGVTVRHAASGGSTQTNASGNFTLTGLPSGTVDLEFERADIHARGRVPVRGGGTTTVTISIVGSSAVVAPSGHAGAELEGLVSANDGSTLTVLDQRLGAVVVHTDGSTLIRSGDTAIPLSQIQVGMRVHVKALQQDDESYLATEVRLQGERVGGSRHVSGSVVSVDAGDGSFVVDGGGADVEVRTDSSTMFKRRGGSASFGDLAVGVPVEVNGILQADGTVLARKITIES
jgi:hypothetical protein